MNKAFVLWTQHATLSQTWLGTEESARKFLTYNCDSAVVATVCVTFRLFPANPLVSRYLRHSDAMDGRNKGARAMHVAKNCKCDVNV